MLTHRLVSVFTLTVSIQPSIGVPPTIVSLQACIWYRVFTNTNCQLTREQRTRYCAISTEESAQIAHARRRERLLMA